MGRFEIRIEFGIFVLWEHLSHTNNGTAEIWYFRQLTKTPREANWFDTAASANALNSLFLVFAPVIQKIRHRHGVFTGKSWLR